MATSDISPRDLSPRLAVLCEPEESTPSLPASRSFAARDGLARQALGVSFTPHLEVLSYNQIECSGALARDELESHAAVESSARDELGSQQEHAATSNVGVELDDELAR